MMQEAIFLLRAVTLVDTVEVDKTMGAEEDDGGNDADRQSGDARPPV